MSTHATDAEDRPRTTSTRSPGSRVALAAGPAVVALCPRDDEVAVVGLAPFHGLVPADDVLGRTVDGAMTGTQRLARRRDHPRHVAWLEGGGPDPPARLATWLADGSLVRDDTPRLRWVAQTLPDGSEVGGPLGCATLRELVLHEGVSRTAVRRRRQRDRTQEVDARPLLAVLAADPPELGVVRAALTDARAETDLRDGAGVRHRVWVLDATAAAAVCTAVAGSVALLADGHHRVAAAQAEGVHALPTLLATAATPPRLLPVWRVVVSDAEDAAVAAWMRSREPPGQQVHVRGRGHAVRWASGDELPVLAAARLATDVPGFVRLHTTADERAADVGVRDGAVVLGAPAPTVAEVLTYARTHGPLPPKSTAFQPKPRVGLVLAQRAG